MIWCDVWWALLPQNNRNGEVEIEIGKKPTSNFDFKLSVDMIRTALEFAFESPKVILGDIEDESLK